MRKRPYLPEHVKYEEEMNRKFVEILEISKRNTLPDWKEDDLEKVLKTLKRNQSQDTMEMVNELFIPKNIGTDLKESLLLLFNGIKNNMHITDFFKKVYI